MIKWLLLFDSDDSWINVAVILEATDLVTVNLNPDGCTHSRGITLGWQREREREGEE